MRNEPTSQEPGSAPFGRPSVRRVVQVVLGLALAGVLLGVALPRLTSTSWGHVADTIGTVGLPTAVGLFVLMLAGLWAYTFTLTGSLPGLTHPRALVVNVAGSAVGNLLPGGGAAGVAVTYLMCRSWGFSRRDISTSIIVSGVWNILARVALPVVGLAVLIASPVSLPSAVVRGGLVGAVGGAALLAVFVGVVASEATANRVGHALDVALTPLSRRLRKGKDVNIDALIADLRRRMASVVHTGWAAMTGGLVGFFGLYFLLFWLCLAAVGVHLSPAQVFAAYAVGRLLTAVGITPGGLGFTETGTALVLTSWGAHPTAAVAGVVLFSLYSHLAELPLGALGWLAWAVGRRRRAGQSDRRPTLVR
ncbi:MAG TPA: lysylphosphatidylglycerol synthase transmembrane domain-containing protein [Segeticoccus sp.]|uniref:lysylphosphatidylglycerol synthase transmembrane domain-containing protein n=1 Tax=Segeticoccus sp. TaxID=2706531 RepID=UPI002D7ECD86|nr:lysylphosphatidylglycerol synthase transmembrane domain-containing protein [Segeticoccus sp.]HET8601939.1 lysylphosphatidylglycerol synthase transmembrane domain-containing protein [Segeticoccus sp.]